MERFAFWDWGVVVELSSSWGLDKVRYLFENMWKEQGDPELWHRIHNVEEPGCNSQWHHVHSSEEPREERIVWMLGDGKVR